MKELRRLLKHLTPFDYFGLVVVVIILLASYFFFYRKSEYVNIRVRVTELNVLYATNNPKFWYADRFKVGDVERDTLGRVLAEVVDVDTFNYDKDTKAVYLDLRVRATYDSRTKIYSLRGKPLVFGIPITFNLSGITFQGIVTEFPNSNFQINLRIKESLARVVVRGINENANDENGDKRFTEPVAVESIKKGDKIVDSRGSSLAEVVDITLRPAQRITTDDRGNLLLRFDPYYKDAFITLKLRTKVVDNSAYVFDYLPLRLGEELPLSFGTTYVKGEVIQLMP
jgi:hypothetical protein